MAPKSPTPKPLSDSEYEQLGDWLEEASPLGLNGVLGLMHAVAVAPSLLPPSTWLPVVLPEGLGAFEPPDVQQFLGLLLRLYADVQDAVTHEQTMTPEPEDIEEWESFAFGYAAGAELDPEWIGDDARWTFAAGFAYLGGRLDLVPQKIIEDIERSYAPDPKAFLRRDMGALIVTAEESFRKHRQAAPPAAMASADRSGAHRVGRNEPCPCGSGKKYKRCCIRSEMQ